MTAPDLSALVSARLCHDLISPIGAIGNGLELLELAQGPGGPELALVNESLATALAKLRFFRVAFGPVEPHARIPRDEIAQICDAMFHGRFTVAWERGGGDIARPLARIACLAILCLERSLPMGGEVRVATADRALSLATDGRRTAPPAPLWAHVTQGAALGELKPDSVQFALLRRALEATGGRLTAEFRDGGADVRIADLSPSLAAARS